MKNPILLIASEMTEVTAGKPYRGVLVVSLMAPNAWEGLQSIFINVQYCAVGAPEGVFCPSTSVHDVTEGKYSLKNLLIYDWVGNWTRRPDNLELKIRVR